MAFNLQTWREQCKEQLKGWKQRMVDYKVETIYGIVATSALWPVVEAFRQGDLAAIAALGGVLAGVGTNLLANRMQSWKNEADAARQIEQAVAADAKLRDELDAVLKEMDALPQATLALPENERAWFAQTLQEELRRLGNLEKFSAVLIGSGALAQGQGNVVAGAGGVAIGGNVKGSVIITGHGNVVQ